MTEATYRSDDTFIADGSTTFLLKPVARLQSDYPDKFGIPRQPGLASAARGRLVMLPPFDDPLALRGLEGFSHLWLTFIFHQSPDQGPERWSPLVRPPRLGGNAKIGVFASRSTHRPNRLGLSLVELVAVHTRPEVYLELRGHDLVDGTPVVDIKPYLPWTDTRPDARAGFAPAPPKSYPVEFSRDAEIQLTRRSDRESLRALIEQVLAQDPRPAYRKGQESRRYGVRLRDLDVRFRAIDDPQRGLMIRVVELVPLSRRS